MIGLVTLLLLHGGPVTTQDLVYPGSRLLLEDRVMGRELEIRWSCYATRDAVEMVATRYARDPRLSPASWRMEGNERGYQSRVDPELHVAIFPTQDLARHSPCQAKLEAGEQTIVQVSLGLRRQSAAQKPDASIE